MLQPSTARCSLEGVLTNVISITQIGMSLEIISAMHVLMS